MLMWAVPAGLAVGFALGALGGGGSILTVPALIYLLGQSVPSATTGSLLIVGSSALVGAVSHRRAGTLRVGAGILFGVLGTAGSYVGTRLSVGVRPAVLLTAFAALIVVVAVLMIHRQRQAPRLDTAAGPAAAATPHRADTRMILSMIGAATGVGLLTGFFGVGGGFAVVPALVLVVGFSMPVAVGTSLLVISINSATALVSRAVSGATSQVDWTVVITFAALSWVGSYVGAWLSHRIDERWLSKGFIALLLALAAFIAATNIPQL